MSNNFTEEPPRPEDPLEGEKAAQEARAAAERWVKWARFDFEHFLDPLAREAGLTRTEALLYILGERLGEVTDNGLLFHMVVHHDDGPPEEEEPWKRGRKE